MITAEQIDDSFIENARSNELSTSSDIVTRTDVLRKMYIINNTNKSIVETELEEEIEHDRQRTESAKIIDKIVSLPKFKTLPSLRETPFARLQEWEGYVQNVSDNEFTASLFDITNKRDIEDEEADFSIDDLTEDDKKLLKPGAVFRWLIGYRSIGGTKERSSKIVFRRLPQWTDSDFEAAEKKADFFARKTKWE